jgi:hypothetical protein
MGRGPVDAGYLAAVPRGITHRSLRAGSLACLALVLLCSAWPQRAVAQDSLSARNYVGSLGVMLGIYAADRLEETNIAGTLSRQRRASDMYLVVGGTRHIAPHWALAASIGALARGDAFIRDGSFYTRARLSLFPVSFGLRFYPVAPAGKGRILPYLAAGGSLVVGVQVFESSTFQFNYSSETSATLGGLAGAGVDYRVADRLLFGLYAGYQRARFSKPLSDLPGGVSDFSGPQFMLSFSYLIAGTGGGPRGEGSHGN